MVRLKGLRNVSGRAATLFQFHYGTIKRVLYVCQPLISTHLFQFHYGTIKRTALGDALFLDINFNSTMVRLKDCYKLAFPYHPDYFNSTMVRLKGG